MSDEFNAGDLVRVKDPNGFLMSFANRIRDRDALVVWVGPDNNGQYLDRCKVKFLKRNGRGQEFYRIMRIHDLMLKEPS